MSPMFVSRHITKAKVGKLRKRELGRRVSHDLWLPEAFSCAEIFPHRQVQRRRKIARLVIAGVDISEEALETTV